MSTALSRELRLTDVSGHIVPGLRSPVWGLAKHFSQILLPGWLSYAAVAMADIGDRRKLAVMILIKLALASECPARHLHRAKRGMPRSNVELGIWPDPLAPGWVIDNRA